MCTIVYDCVRLCKCAPVTLMDCAGIQSMCVFTRLSRKIDYYLHCVYTTYTVMSKVNQKSRRPLAWCKKTRTTCKRTLETLAAIFRRESGSDFSLPQRKIQFGQLSDGQIVRRQSEKVRKFQGKSALSAKIIAAKREQLLCSQKNPGKSALSAKMIAVKREK